MIGIGLIAFKASRNHRSVAEPTENTTLSDRERYDKAFDQVKSLVKKNTMKRLLFFST